MARADLLLDLVRSGSRGDQQRFRKTVEALVSEERQKQHHVLADRLAAQLPPSSGHLNGNGAPVATRSGTLGDALVEIAPSRRLADLVLEADVATACQELVEEQLRRDLLRAHSLEPRSRVLLAGPPGNGKTSLAEALAAELSVPLLVVRYEAVIASYLGETAARLSRLFEQARMRHAVLFFDEFDVVGKERGDVHETGEIKRVVSSLLLQIDTLPSHVVVVTATNHPELLDRAVWRRFQLRLHLRPPTSAQAADWLARFEARSTVKLEPGPSELANYLRGLSFAEIEDFATDVLRRIVLSEPVPDVERILRARLDQLRARFVIPTTPDEEGARKSTHARRR